MHNKDIARLLRNVAASYAIKNEKKYYFQIIAYQKAAEAIESSATEARDAYEEGRLEKLKGVGPSIRQHLEELFTTGKVKHFDVVMEDIPPAVFPLLNIPSFGPKKAYKLVEHFKLKDPKTVIADLKKHAEKGEIAGIESFGEKSQSLILQAINEYEQGVAKNVRMVLPFAGELADNILSYLRSSKYIIRAEPLGSLRRQRETIGDIDIAVATDNPEKAIEHFVHYPYKERVLEKGPASASILISGGRHVDLMVQPKDRFGSLLQHFTGSKEHNIALREYALKKGLSLSEYGIKKTNVDSPQQTFSSEEKFYEALGLSFIPPEIRENTGEIALAAKNELPNLITLSDIKGDFHIHSSYPIEPSHDLGKNTIAEMVKKAEALGYSFIALSEHNPSVSKHTYDQILRLIEKRNKEIDHVQKDNKSIRIFKMLEVDILSNGNLAINDEAASTLDAFQVSVHSAFSMTKKDMTKRVLAGLSHPKAKILSHPTGRLLNQRSGYELDWDDIFDFATKHKKALEINSWPQRLDLPDSLVREGIRHGVKFTIATDSHALHHMDLMKYGVAVARRGWATKDDIINALEYNEIAAWLHDGS